MLAILSSLYYYHRHVRLAYIYLLQPLIVCVRLNMLTSLVLPPVSEERPEDASKKNLVQVTTSIQKTLGLLHQLNLIVSSFNSASQLPHGQRRPCSLSVAAHVVYDDALPPCCYSRLVAWC
jgi:hypothetical protein